ncbi:MAG: DUF305 domain-containing protein [Candidatus Sulfotelmatobacter sp.]
MRLAKIIGLAVLVLIIGPTAIAQQPHHGMTQAEMQKMMDDMMPLDSDTPSTKAFKEAQMKMMQAMHIRYSGNANVDFVRNMIPHHQGAIEMARVMLAHGNDPQLKAMAQKIITDQEREIGEMQEWLKKNAK